MPSKAWRIRLACAVPEVSMSQITLGLPRLATVRLRETDWPAGTDALSDVGDTSISGSALRSAIGMRATGIAGLLGVSTTSPNTVCPSGSSDESADRVTACVPALATVNEDGDKVTAPAGRPLTTAVQLIGAVRVLLSVRGKV